LIEFLQQVVGELDVGLVDLVDQEDYALVGLERLPQLALLDVVANVVEALVARAGCRAGATDRIVFVEALLRLGGGLDVPGDQARTEGFGQLFGEHGLAGARFTLDQQRTLQGDGGVDRELEVVGGDVGLGAFELHRKILER
jgi:hypothetical protein